MTCFQAQTKVNGGNRTKGNVVGMKVFCSLHDRNNKNFQVLDHFSIERTIYSVGKHFHWDQCSLVHRFQWQSSRLIAFDFSRILIGRKIKGLQNLFPLRKCTYDLFLGGRKTQLGQPNQPESRGNASLLFFSAWPWSTTVLLQRSSIGCWNGRWNSLHVWGSMILLLWNTTSEVKIGGETSERMNTAYPRPVFHGKDDQLIDTIIFLESVFIHQPCPMEKHLATCFSRFLFELENSFCFSGCNKWDFEHAMFCFLVALGHWTIWKSRWISVEDDDEALPLMGSLIFFELSKQIDWKWNFLFRIVAFE